MCCFLVVPTFSHISNSAVSGSSYDHLSKSTFLLQLHTFVQFHRVLQNILKLTTHYLLQWSAWSHCNVCCIHEVTALQPALYLYMEAKITVSVWQTMTCKNKTGPSLDSCCMPAAICYLSEYWTCYLMWVIWLVLLVNIYGIPGLIWDHWFPQ
jgi:hypothetical protein